jgi:hypothetical protein
MISEQSVEAIQSNPKPDTPRRTRGARRKAFFGDLIFSLRDLQFFVVMIYFVEG